MTVFKCVGVCVCVRGVCVWMNVEEKLMLAAERFNHVRQTEPSVPVITILGHSLNYNCIAEAHSPL